MRGSAGTGALEEHTDLDFYRMRCQCEYWSEEEDDPEDASGQRQKLRLITDSAGREIAHRGALLLYASARFWQILPSALFYALRAL